MKPLTHDTLYGNWATLLLATDHDGNIDYGRLSDEIDYMIAAHCNGIYSNGTAGEFYAQSTEEFVEISRILSEKCEKAGIPYQIGVSHMSAQASLERLRLIRELRPGAVQVILPDWFPVTIDESITFMEKMAEEAEEIPLVLYNPPHAKVRLAPQQWIRIKEQIPSLTGVKVFDNNRDPEWYDDMRKWAGGLSVFIPGHHLATGVSLGAHGAYSNVACINPAASQRWYDMMSTDMEAALEMETRINVFMSRFITPYIAEQSFPNHACDRFMALVGGWADVGARMRWPYRSIPVSEVPKVRKALRNILPEFCDLT